MRRATADALARAASLASPCSSSSAAASFTTTTPAAARVGARATGRVIPGRGRRADPDAPPAWWAADGWFEAAVEKGGGVAAARALERRVGAMGAQGERERERETAQGVHAGGY